MKKVHTHETVHSSLNSKMEDILHYLSDSGIYFSFKLADRLKERNLTMREFSKMTGLRLATISDICNGKKQSLNLHHILICMLVLRITDITEIAEIVFPEDLKIKYENEANIWKTTDEIPEAVEILMQFLKGEFDGQSYSKLENDERILRNSNVLRKEALAKRKG